jgi:hypothetical protein
VTGYGALAVIVGLIVAVFWLVQFGAILDSRRILREILRTIRLEMESTARDRSIGKK